MSSVHAARGMHSSSPILSTYGEEKEEEKFQVKVHSELVADLDYDHAKALDIPLRDCTDEQLIVELARRKVDIQHRVTSELVTKYYHFEKLLGHGASGKVYLVYHRESGEKFACKVIKKDGSMNDAQSMSTEIEIMKRCRHAHIVSLYELFESSICMWLILELVEGSGLRGGLANHAHYTEQVAARFVKQMCMGLHYLHNHGVIHRDVKIDNILLNVRGNSGHHDDTYVKITDFGLSALVKVGMSGYHAESCKRKDFTGCTEMWGTPTHYAPELIDRAYGPQADMWSLGCVIYEMLTGYEAFPSPNGMPRHDLYANIKHARYDKKRLADLNISPEAQDLLTKILQPNPLTRYSASECLKHPWITGESVTEHHRSARLGSVIEMFSANMHLPSFTSHDAQGGNHKEQDEKHDDDDKASGHISSPKPKSIGTFAYLFGSVSSMGGTRPASASASGPRRV